MKKNYSHYLIIVGVCLLAFYQIAFLQESLKWDNLDAYLPMRYFVGECLRNGIYPLWLPYQGLGCPIFGDLINTNYAEAVFIGRLMPYDNVVLHVVFMGYIILAGFGMYRLALQLKIKPEIALMLAIAYSMSGFMVGNAQHLQYIISGAWIPFIIRYYFQLTAERKTSVWLKFILVTYLQVSGGYPAHTIFAAYLLAAIFITKIIRDLTLKNYSNAFAFLRSNLFALLILGLLCFGIFLSIKQASSFVSRYTGMSPEMSAFNPFTPECLISLISPLTPAAYSELFNTDLSMNNLYFGVIVLVFFIYGITRPLSHNSILFLTVGIVSLLIALGPNFFFHRLAYQYLPLFNFFRHPSNLRLFTILSFLLVTGIQMTRYDMTEGNNRLRLKRVLLIVLCVLFLSALFSAFMVARNSMDLAGFKLSFSALIRDYGIYGPLLIQLIIACIFLSLLYMIVFLTREINRLTAIIFLVIAEMVIFTQMNAPYTIFYANSDPIDLQRHLRGQPRGFPLPDHHTMAENTENSVTYDQFVENANTYAKTVSVEKSYPFVPDGYTKLMADTVLCLASCNNRLIYLAEKVLPLSKRDTYTTNPFLDTKTVFVPDTLYKQDLSLCKPQSFIGDTIIPVQVTPSLIEAKVRTSTRRLCVLLQNNFIGWKTYVDDKEVDHFSVNHTLIGVMVPSGNHRLKYEFKNPVYVKATLFSFSFFILMLYLASVLSIMERWRTGRKRIYGWILPSIPLGLLVFLLLKPRITWAENQKSINNTIIQTLNSTITKLSQERTFIILNTESPDPFTGVNPSDGILFQRFRTPGDLIKVWNVIDTLSKDKLIYAWSNVLENPETDDIIRLYFPTVSQRFAGDRYTILVYSRESDTAECREFRSMNNFEYPSAGWSYDRSSLDSTRVFSGRYAEKLSPGREYSSTFRYNIDHVPAEGIKVSSALKFYREDNQDCDLVITVIRDNKTLHYQIIGLNVFYPDEKGWNKIFASQYYPESDLKKGDVITVYCWNIGKNRALYIDDFLVKIE